MADAVFTFLHDHKGMPFRTMAVYNWLLEAALLGGLLVLLVLLARALLRGKAGSRVICLAWVLVAVRLLIPVALPNPLMNELKPTLSLDPAARPVADQFRVRFIDAMNNLAWDANVNDSLARFNAPYDLAKALNDVATYTEYGWLAKWYFFAYLAGVGGVGVFMLCRGLGFRRRLKRAAKGALEGDALVAYHQLCDELGRIPLPVTICEGLPDACAVGVFRPRIALPDGLTDAERQAALRRAMSLTRYPAWALLRDVCCALQWFNPLVWVAALISRYDQLRAADERMAAALPPDERAAHAAALRKASARKASPALSVLASPMALRAAATEKRAAALEAEAEKPDPRWRTGVLVGFCVLTLASFFVANTGLPKASQVMWNDDGAYGYLSDGSEAAPYDPSDDPYFRYSIAQYTDISVEKAVEYARADMIENDGFPENELNAERFTAVFDAEGSKYYARYLLARDEAGEAGRAYLDCWFPGADECELVWVFSDYDTIHSKGRAGRWLSAVQPGPDGVTGRQANDTARAALVSCWGMDEAAAQAVVLDGEPMLFTHDPIFAKLGWPSTYWKVYLSCHSEPGSPCRLVCIDKATGEVFLFFDFVQNG